MKHLKLNDQAPSFSAKDENGNSIDSKQFEGKKWVIYFYPKDLTPGCTVQACNIRDNYEKLKDGTMERAMVSELNNTAGKIIATVTTELKYQNQHGVKKPIDFLEY